MNKTIRALAAAATLISCAIPALAVDWNHDPGSAIGPGFWGTLPAGGILSTFATCGSNIRTAPALGFVEVGLKQSPINIVQARTVPSTLPPLLPLYGNTPFEVENTGHVVEVPYAAGNRLFVGVDAYELVQFHFHTRSEHQIDGTATDMEMHLVHQNSLGDLAVLGVMLRVGQPANRLLDEIVANAPFTAGAAALEGRTINARNLLPFSLAYYTYSGSLTTPSCAEGVRWLLLKNPVNVSQATVDRLQQIVSLFPGYAGYRFNNRPVRPLNGRPVLSTR